MTNLEDQLRQRLRTTADRVVVPPDFAAHAHHRGVRRRRRRRLLLATPVVVAATGLGVLAWLLPSPATTSLTPATTTETAAATAPVELTPDLEADLTALRPSGLLTAGQNDPFTQQIPLSQWTTWLPCDQVSRHLGISLPTFDRLDGYQLRCGSQRGAAIFDREVPSVPSGLADEEATRVEIAYIPPGVDEQTTTIAQATAQGMSWILISYGGDLGGSGGEAPGAGRLGQPDTTAVSLRTGESAVAWMAESGTAIGWTSTVGGHAFALSMYQPRTPLESVRVFSGGHDVPL